MVLFVILNFHLLPPNNDPDTDGTAPSYSIKTDSKAIHPSIQLETPLKNHPTETRPKFSVSDLIRSVHPRVVIAPGSNLTLDSLKPASLVINDTNLGEIKVEIQRINREQRVNNLEKFGLALGPESIVIVVQVHDRIAHLKHLISSLSKVRGIENVLLIFSHDIYTREVNDLVQSVTFCPVLQIFFTYSQQIYHDTFPGEDTNDCPRDMKKDQALEKKCNNAEHPDKYGHYREAKYCQTKHHWLWKLRFVFEQVHLLDGFEGHVLLLEDDYYVSEDILFVIQMLQNVKAKDCTDCRMLVLGNYDKNQNFKVYGGKVERAYWVSSKHNMGMAFTRTFWEEIKKCGKEFCVHDDYNWDWTLQHLSMKCIPDKVRLLKMKAARVFHIGECGMHTKSKNCDPTVKVGKTETLLSDNKQHLFPNTLSVDGDAHFKLRDPKLNGGWGDIRDHNMCLSILNNSSYFEE
jgi:alpha-1,6-mannosyl-glycoprotein beta-1,2-N-acetylglucosaminyltransferase